MNCNLLHLVLCYIVASSSVSSAPMDRVSGLEHPNNQTKEYDAIFLTSFGAVDGKAFFADPTKRTWASAKFFCAAQNIRLATITTVAQYNLLKSKHSLFSEDHWTAARDSFQPRQFTWEDLNTEMPSNAGMSWANHVTTPQTCAAYYASGSGGMHIKQCLVSLKVLCETFT